MADYTSDAIGGAYGLAKAGYGFYQIADALDKLRGMNTSMSKPIDALGIAQGNMQNNSALPIDDAYTKAMNSALINSKTATQMADASIAPTRERFYSTLANQQAIANAIANQRNISVGQEQQAAGQALSNVIGYAGSANPLQARAAQNLATQNIGERMLGAYSNAYNERLGNYKAASDILARNRQNVLANLGAETQIDSERRRLASMAEDAALKNAQLGISQKQDLIQRAQGVSKLFQNSEDSFYGLLRQSTQQAANRQMNMGTGNVKGASDSLAKLGTSGGNNNQNQSQGDIKTPDINYDPNWEPSGSSGGLTYDPNWEPETLIGKFKSNLGRV